MKTASERTPLKVNLPVDLTERLAEVVPAGKRSRFVEQALETALKAEAKSKLLAMLDDLPAHSTDGENSIEVLRGLRQERSDQLVSRHKSLAQ